MWESEEKMMLGSLLVASVLLAIVTLTLNILVLAVLFAVERVEKQSIALVSLCFAHVWLAMTLVVEQSVRFGSEDYLPYYLNVTVQGINRTSVSNSSAYHGLGTLGCSLPLYLVNAAQMTTVLNVLLVTIDQYVYIEFPFFHANYVRRKSVIVLCTSFAVVSHIMAFLPLINQHPGQGCTYRMVVGVEFSAVLGSWLIIPLPIIVGLYMRMMFIAAEHRRRMAEYNNIQMKVTKFLDSLYFLLVIAITYSVSSVTPGLCLLIGLNREKQLPHRELNILFLLGPIVYALAYGSRFPNGLVKNIKLAVCCCFPVEVSKDVGKLEVEQAVRMAVMRLGRVMVKVDEQAAIRRHTTYLQKKEEIRLSFGRWKAVPISEPRLPLRETRSAFPARTPEFRRFSEATPLKRHQTTWERLFLKQESAEVIREGKFKKATASDNYRNTCALDHPVVPIPLRPLSADIGTGHVTAEIARRFQMGTASPTAESDSPRIHLSEGNSETQLGIMEEPSAAVQGDQEEKR